MLDTAALNTINTELLSALPNLTTSQSNSILIAGNFRYVVATYLPLSVVINIANITASASHIDLNKLLDIVPLDSANVAKITENLVAGIPNIPQSQIDSTINDINVLYTIYTQLPANAISNLFNLVYNLSISTPLSLDSSVSSNITTIINAALPNVTKYQMSTVLNAVNDLSQVASLLPLNILINITGILTTTSGFNLPLPVALFDNMKSFSTSTATSIKNEILAATPSISLSRLDYIIFQMDIVYTVAFQLPISAIAAIYDVVFAEYFHSSPYLDSTSVSNITIETSTALPNVNSRQLRSFVDAIEFLFVMATPLPLNSIQTIYGYAVSESNINGPIPTIPPVFKDTNDFSPSVVASIIDLLTKAIADMSSYQASTAELDSIIYSINTVYNVAQRVPISTSIAIQEVMYNLFINRVGYVDSPSYENITQEVQTALPKLNIYQNMIILSSFSMLLQYASILPINYVLKISVITSNASNIALPSPSPIVV